MPASSSVLDFAGREVVVGSRVRVLGFSTLRGLTAFERRRAKSMIGEVFTVEEIDDSGLAWVTKWWHLGNGRHDAHGVGLSASEMELAGDPGVA
jgi:hypothetical protein